jgi:Zn-dependent peptidase ImmA (M78 family)
LSRRLRQELDDLIDSEWPAYKQGQRLALSLRHDHDLFTERSERADPERLLNRLGVRVERWALDSRSLDAVAVWGRGAAPWIVVNDHEKHAANLGAERATIAHELCHLLVDRQDVLPLSAVVGGIMDRTAEQRANAFAAEFLCPRFYVRQAYDQLMSAGDVIDQVTKHFGVSRELAALQLARAGCYLTASDQREVEEIVQSDASLPWR